MIDDNTGDSGGLGGGSDSLLSSTASKPSSWKPWKNRITYVMLEVENLSERHVPLQKQILNDLLAAWVKD